MKKYLPLVIVGILIIVFLFIKNENNRNELKLAKNEIKELEKIENIIYVDAEQVAKDFILSYFNYEGKPEREEVENYISKEKIKELNFNSSEDYDENLNDVISSVEDLEIYYGKSTDNRQKVLSVFENDIEVDGVVTSINSFIELDLEENGGDWKIVELSFFQY